MSPTIDRLLRYPRVLGTMTAAKSFQRQRPTPRETDGQVQFRMRSAMDLDPRLGKWISKRAFTSYPAEANILPPPSASRLIDQAEIPAALTAVRQNGFYVFDKVIDADFVSSIRAFAESAPCQARGFDSPRGVYPRSAPQAGRYDFDEQTALQCSEVQEFVSDPAMVAIARSYLGQPVLLDEMAFWWTTTQRSDMANQNAQLFHQDRNRLSFLKFFMYLTDVTLDSGPHVVLRGSHRSIPPSLRSDGRKDDAAVVSAGLASDIREITGPAGSLMVVDTIGLHKGKTPIARDRLAIEIQLSTSLFGAPYEMPVFSPTDLLRERFSQMPWVLQRYAGSIAQ
jgi:hypothetical protein